MRERKVYVTEKRPFIVGGRKVMVVFGERGCRGCDFEDECLQRMRDGKDVVCKPLRLGFALRRL